MWRVVLAAIVVPSLLYMADQEFAGGRYTLKSVKAAQRVQNWIGVSGARPDPGRSTVRNAVPA